MLGGTKRRHLSTVFSDGQYAVNGSTLTSRSHNPAPLWVEDARPMANEVRIGLGRG